MSYKLVEDSQKKACPKGAVAVSQACRLLDVGRSGYYAHQAAHKQRLGSPAVCTASVHLKAAFAASHKAYGSRRLATAMAERGLAMGSAPGAHPDAPQRYTACLAAQVCLHHRQQTHYAGITQRAGQLGLGQRHHVSPYAQRLAVSGSNAGPAFAQDCGLGDGSRDACNAGLHGLANGYRAAQSCRRSGGAFGPGSAAWVQGVVATPCCQIADISSFSASAGVLQPSVLRGLPFSNGGYCVKFSLVVSTHVCPFGKVLA